MSNAETLARVVLEIEMILAEYTEAKTVQDPKLVIEHANGHQRCSRRRRAIAGRIHRADAGEIKKAAPTRRLTRRDVKELPFCLLVDYVPLVP